MSASTEAAHRSGARGRDIGRRCPDGRPTRSVARSVPTWKSDEVGIVIGVEQHVARPNVAMDDALAMGGAERRPDLLRPVQRDRGADVAARQPIGEASARHHAHDQVGGIRLTPPVDECDDVRLLEARDAARIGIEATDEVGIVRDLPAEHLDHDLAFGVWVDRPMHDAERPGRDLADDAIPAQGLAVQVESRVVVEDLPLDRLQGRRRVEPELVVERLFGGGGRPPARRPAGRCDRAPA